MINGDIFIRLMQKKGNSLSTIENYHLESAKDVEIVISNDGKYMAVLRK